MQRFYLASIVLMIGLLAGACDLRASEASGGGNGEPVDPPGNPPAGSVDEAKDAVVYIQSRGGLARDEQRRYGQFSDLAYGQGSGFIMDPSGIAITNNHVVAGAGVLDVYVPGEEEPLVAEVLGVSECSDLALIDIEGGGYPYLAWSKGKIESNLNVTAVGYPADDIPPGEQPDQEISTGVINSTEANGDSPWSSVDSVIQHQAPIRPGNSGGPLVDESGKVVGINYQTYETQIQQQFAISRDVARATVRDLRMGDVTAMGVNGEAAPQWGGTIVYSVETGSPAFEAGVRGFQVNEGTGDYQLDVIKEIEDTKLAEDGTMQVYCDILRAHDPEDPLSIKVERYSLDAASENLDITGLNVLEGVLNGEELQGIESAAERQYANNQGSEGGNGSESGYTTVDTGTLTMEVPSGWSDTENGTWVDDKILGGSELGPYVVAAPDLDSYFDSWDTPGVWFSASRALVEKYPEKPVEQILDLDFMDYSDSCEYEGTYAYDDGTYVGKEDVWTNCGDTGMMIHNIVALPPNGSHVAVVQIILDAEADHEAALRITETFDVIGDL